MTFINRLNGRLSSLAAYLNGNKKRVLLAGSVLYTAVFALFFSITILPTIIDTGTFMGCDGNAQFYPYLLDFRRNLLTFAESVKNGRPQLPMMNFDYYFGTDILTSSALNFIPFFPFYALSAFVPEAGIPMFFAVGVVLLAYLSGFSFMYLCSYYGKNMLWSGLMAPFYVFCGNFLFTAVANPQFIYMFIAFPLMIVGMDRLLTDKSPLLFILSVFWLSSCGFVFIVYTLPFVVVFAIIRVYFLYKKRFLPSLGKYFFRGCLSAVLGIAMAGFIFLPFLKEYISSVRVDSGISVNIAELLIPSVKELSESFSGIRPNFPTGISAALIPCFLYVFTSPKTRKEIKCCCFVMLGLIALPVIRYGLNGFAYELCRWGFVPALLICSVAAEYNVKLLRMSRAQRKMFLFVLVVYIIAMVLRLREPAVIFMTVMAGINCIPPLKRLAFKIIGLPLKFLGALKNSYNKNGSVPVLAAAGAAVLAVIIAVTVIISSKSYTLTPSLIISSAAVLILSFAKRNKALCSVLLACVYIFTGAMNFGGAITGLYRVEENSALEAVAELQPTENTFGRVSQLVKDCAMYAPLSEEETTEEDTAAEETFETDGAFYGSDTYLNLAPRFEIPSAEVFRSTVNADLMNFLRRCGQEQTSLSSSGDIQGFSGKEVLYSLFGIEDLFTFSPEDCFYGFEKSEYTEYEDGTSLQLYKNRYALPAGVAYTSIISGEAFSSFNSAELPYAMMDSVYLEGYEPEETAEVRAYSKACDFTLAQELRGETTKGMKCYNNTITVKDDLSGSFVYLCFEGVKSNTYADALSESFTVTVDNSYNRIFSVHNQNANWEWKYITDYYCLALGYTEENINEIFFISPFEFESVTLYAVPEEIYTEAYSDRCAEILENVKVSTNTLTGDISLSEDSVLSVNLLYSEGWTAYVDGEKVPVYKANGLFLGIPLDAGSHEIQLEYRTPWLAEGIILSATAWAVLTAIMVMQKKAKKK